MNIQSLSLVVGTKACDANCTFCVSKMTGFDLLPKVRAPLHRGHLRKAIQLAQLGGCSTCLITGKGEPTLYPDEVTAALVEVEDKFPFIELQTNGLMMERLRQLSTLSLSDPLRTRHKLQEHHLRSWFGYGLNTIALSTSGFLYPTEYGLDDDMPYEEKLRIRLMETNEHHYGRPYFNVPLLVDYLRSFGFTVRLCIMAQSDGINTTRDLALQLKAAKQLGVSQVTVRPITAPNDNSNPQSQQAIQYVHDHAPDMFEPLSHRVKHTSAAEWAEREGVLLRTLVGGGRVFDIKGQNLALYNCLTTSGDDPGIRSLIYYSNGKLTYSWQYGGAILLNSVYNGS